MKLWQYLAKRLYHTIITILIVLVILYALFQAMPGDPASMLKNPQMDMNAIRTIEEMYGLNDPWYVQFGNYIRNMAGYPLTNDPGTFNYVTQERNYTVTSYATHANVVGPGINENILPGEWLHTGISVQVTHTATHTLVESTVEVNGSAQARTWTILVGDSQVVGEKVTVQGATTLEAQTYAHLFGGVYVMNDTEDLQTVHTNNFFGFSFVGSRPLLEVEFKYCPLTVGKLHLGLPVGVDGILKERIPPTLLLFGSATIFAYTIGCSIGAVLAWKHGTKMELGAIFLSLIFYSMPLFWFGLILLWAFASPLGVAKWLSLENPLFPLGGYGGFDPDTGVRYSGFDRWIDIGWHLVLPLFTLCILSLAGDVLLMRNSMLEVMGDDFINTARAKGCSESRILFRHAARNAMLPVVTSFALSLGGVIGGGVLTETVFSWPGMGRELVGATISQDFPVVFTLFYIMALMTILGNVAADLLYAYLDPRVRL